MDEETMRRIENMIRDAIKDMFDANYCPHGSECRFCREDKAVNMTLYDMEWYNESQE